jgi:homoserine kinase
MRKIKIRLPATITNIGPDVNSLGLALQLYTTVEISPRADSVFNVQINGEGADHFETELLHPVSLAIGRFSQHLERAQPGLDIKVDNDIPLNSGLGAETAMTVAGVWGANNVMDELFSRDQLLALAAELSAPHGVVSTLVGGLTTTLANGDGTVIYRDLPITPMEVIVVLPEIENFSPTTLPERIALQDALYNINRIPLLIDALGKGDYDLLPHALDDRLNTPRLSKNITGYGYVLEMSRRMGVVAMTTCGTGPALLLFAKDSRQHIADEMVLAFKSAGVEARSWVLPVDTQGVVISAMQSV